MRSFAWANNGAPRPVVITALVVATLAAVIAVSVLRAERAGVRVSMVAADDPYVALDREITAEFGMQNPVVWVIEADNGSVWTPTLLARIQALTRDVLTIPGVIALDVVSLASPNMRDLRVTEDALEPEYLMSEPPQTTDAIGQLRRRVDNDPNYGGILVSRDGRAAMVVANFVEDADAQAVAAGALALRERYSDALARVAVTGAPVLAVIAPRVARPLAAGAVCVLAVGLLTLALVSGARVAFAAAVVSVLAVTVSGLLVAALGAAVLPWSAYAMLPTALIGAAVVTAPAASWQVRLDLAVAVAMAFIALGVVAGAPAAAFGIAGAAGVATAMLLGSVARALLRGAPRTLQYPRAVRLGALVLIALGLTGAARLRTSFGLFGYGMRYLPESAAADLQVLARHFPPPTALAVRFRGAPGFVASPEVLAAFDAVANAVRSDPAVVRALSLADVVKMVHRAFNDNRDEFLVIPSDRAMIARYLALAYSPGFRTFVDRGFTQSALWVYLSTDQPGDLTRVLGKIEAQLARQPVPSAHVDLVGGDGAVVLATARAARRLAVGAAALLLLGAGGISVLRGARTGAVALAGGAATAVLACGAFGWLGVPIDLVSLPILVGTAATGMVFGALGGATLCAPALAAMAVLALAGAFAGVGLLGVVAAVLLGAPALAGVLTAGWTRLRSG
jgi:predicted RND superfamily exporter protein